MMRRSALARSGKAAGAPDPTLDLGVQALEAVRGAQSGPVGLGERVELGGGREAPLKAR